MDDNRIKEVRRFFCAELSSTDKRVELKDDELRHLKHVLRLEEGDRINIFNGRGEEVIGVIEKIGKNAAEIKIEERCEPIGKSPARITLLQALLKGDKPEFISEKATELGAEKIVFFSCDRSVPLYKKENLEKKAERLHKAAIGAAKQCGFSFVPEIFISDFGRAISEANGLKIFCYEKPGVPNNFGDELKKHKGKEITILIGPEGGFTETEAAVAEKTGFKPVTLGQRVLRAETAAIVALALAQNETSGLK